MLVTQQSHHKHHNFSRSLAVSGVVHRFHKDSTFACPFPLGSWPLGLRCRCTRGTKHYLSCLSSSPVASTGSSAPTRPPAPALVAICPHLCPLCSAADIRIFPLCNCCPDQLHPLHLQQWTEEGINHIFEEDTLLFISLTPPATGCAGLPTVH